MTVSTKTKSEAGELLEPQFQAAPTKTRGKRSTSEWWQFIGACIFCQLAALLFVDGVLYWVGLGEEDIYKLDKQIGFTHFPNKRVTWRSEGFSQSYFNADGIRDEPSLTVDKPAGVYRIALLGDSMVEGLQVPSNQTFGKLLEQRLHTETGKAIQVINFGTSGYSTAQECMLLQMKVLKYKPDLVVLGYTNRDMFENWTPPDQTLTNVRPRAVHLPGRSLILDNAPVLRWMRSPRAKFLMQIQWLREHSRIWGMISAAETQLSFKDPVYRAIIAFATKPGKTFKEWLTNLRTTKFELPSLQQLASPSFKIRFFESDQDRIAANMVNSSITQAPAAVPGLKFEVAPQLNTPANKTAFKQAVQKPPTKPANGNAAYVGLLTRTMQSLLELMNQKCSDQGAQLAVVFLPCRAEASPVAGLESSFFGITYDNEVSMLQKICAQENIPSFDGEAVLERMPPEKRPALFFLVHLSSKGHQLLSRELYPFISNLVSTTK